MSGDPRVAEAVDRVRSALAAAAGVGAGRPPPASRIAVSRGASPDLREALVVSAGRARVVEADTVWGRAVWATAPADIVVVEQPNWWGLVEEVPTGAIVIDHRVAGWDRRVRQVHRVARTVTQLPGVVAAHPAVEAPWFVVLLPVAQEPVAETLAATGVGGVDAVERRYAELPGGLRLAPPETSQGLWLSSCVACIDRAIGEGGAVGESHGSGRSRAPEHRGG